LQSLGFALGRLKTGTPARLDGRHDRYTSLERQDGDVPRAFSYLTDKITTPQAPATSPRRRRRPLAAAPTSIARRCTQAVESVGPRYCPSIEDKGGALRPRERHQYSSSRRDSTIRRSPNGISTSLHGK